MATFRHDGYTYDLYIRPWKKGDAKYEALRWKTGLRYTWERIPYDVYKEVEYAIKIQQSRII